MTRVPSLLAVLIALAPFVARPTMVSAQDSRAEIIAAAQSEKAKNLAPRQPSAVEQFLLTLRQAVIEAPSGFYPVFGSVYSGGGFTLGGGYRQFFGDHAAWHISGMYSAKSYKLIELGSTSLGHFNGRLDMRAQLGWRDATQVAYHGLGIDSPAEAAGEFRMQQGYGGADVTYRPLRWVVLAWRRDL